MTGRRSAAFLPSKLLFQLCAFVPWWLIHFNPAAISPPSHQDLSSAPSGAGKFSTALPTAQAVGYCLPRFRRCKIQFQLCAFVPWWLIHFNPAAAG
jgi:hypothetical protein